MRSGCDPAIPARIDRPEKRPGPALPTTKSVPSAMLCQPAHFHGSANPPPPRFSAIACIFAARDLRARKLQPNRKQL
jgi:hypothetical protein